MITFYVDSKTGKSQAAGDRENPFATITEALRQAKLGSLIQLNDGEYNAETGETFPLIVPTGVELRGNPGTRRSGGVDCGRRPSL
ncbi:MAG: DUF1565 domain-containing protein [Synechococcaceae cyanobacterium RL_1_2]|nr:DUF1565 domain-containing protein [Synechococcaceae cyanobacterium RL_1_2]